MNDRFRFRAVDNRDWSDEKGTIYYDAEQTYDYLGGTPAVPDNSFGSLLDEEFPGWIVEQCTGKKDVDGKLIYEGDIVLWRRPQTDRDVESICPIVFDDATCSFGPLLNGEACFMPRQTDLWMHVIGNIHENPELLQEK